MNCDDIIEYLSEHNFSDESIIEIATNIIIKCFENMNDNANEMDIDYMTTYVHNELYLKCNI